MTIDMTRLAQLSRRGVLAGLGGMTFCLALGTDGVRLISEAQANTPADAKGQRLGADRAERHGDDPDRRRRNGPRLDDRAADDRGRGDGRRLVEGRARMGAGRQRGLRLHAQQQHAR